MVIQHSNRLIFVHIPKTGGISVTEALGGPAREFRTHAPASHVEALFPGYTKFAILRNPLDWYASSYFFKLAGGKGYAELGTFEDFLDDMLRISERTKRWFKPWPRLDPEAIIEPCLRAGRTGLGFFTLNLLYYGFSDYESIMNGTQSFPEIGEGSPECQLDAFLRLEHLGADFAAMVERYELDLAPDLLRQAPRLNVTPHARARQSVLEAGAIAAIEEADRLVFENFYPGAERLLPVASVEGDVTLPA